MSHAAIDFPVARTRDTTGARAVVSEEEDHGEHYRTSGFVLVGMGALAMGLYALTVQEMVPEGFIDANGILAIACIFVGMGTYMVDVLSVEDR
jgi:hypothetical protein